MNTPSRKKNDGGSSNTRRSGRPESEGSKDSFSHRTDPPGAAGLANEARPGLGTRHDEPFPGEPGEAQPAESEPESPDSVAARQRSGREPNDRPLPRDPQEEPADSWSQDEERSTGVSGHLGG